MVAAVKAASVAAPSSVDRRCTGARARTRPGRGTSATAGRTTDRRAAGRAWRGRSGRAPPASPPLSMAAPVRARMKSSISALPGPVSPALSDPSAPIRVKFATPPILTTATVAGQSRAPGQRLVIDRHERRPLAAGGDIGGPEIVDHRQARAAGRAPARRRSAPSAAGREHGTRSGRGSRRGRGSRSGFSASRRSRRLAMGVGDDPFGLGQRARAAPPGRRGVRASLSAWRSTARSASS